MTNIEQRVKTTIAQQLGIKEEEVLNVASFRDDLEADSLDDIELIMALEEEFQIQITDADAELITSVQAAIDYIASHVED